MTKKSEQVGVDLEHLSQQQVAWIVGKPVSWVRERSHAVLRNQDGSYDVRRLFAASPGILAQVELAADDVERALRAIQYLAGCGRDEVVADALEKFLDDIEHRHGVGGLLAVLQIWRDEWADFVTWMGRRPIESESEIRSRFARECEAAVTEARKAATTDDLLYEVNQCEKCDRFRWGHQWSKQNPKPKLDVSKTLCSDCRTK